VPVAAGSSGDNVATLCADAAEVQTARRAVDLALTRLGRLDVVVNNVGRFLLERIVETTDDECAFRRRGGPAHPVDHARVGPPVRGGTRCRGTRSASSPRAQARGRSETRCTLVVQVTKKAGNSLEGVGGLAVQVNRVAAPVREQVVDQLRQAIVEMRLKPEQRLVERELIEQTGVSRTTIREVLRQLAAEGLVTTIPHKGTVVASPSVERAAELYEVRAVLEGMAARQFAERATDVHLRALRRAFEGIERRAKSGRPNSQAMLEAKRHFYDALFEGAANGTIQSLVESLQARVTVLRAASLSQPGRAAKTVEEVRAIVEALETRDGDAAAAACVHHVNEAARTVFEAMAAAG
jgi:DNA-binding GntR family transcriptional regulator